MVADALQQARPGTTGGAPLAWYPRILLSALPIGVLLTAASLVSLVLPQHDLVSLSELVVLMILTGKCVALAPVVHETLPFSPLSIAHMVVLSDACVAWFVTVNLTALYQLPWVGHGVRSLEASGRSTLARYPWMRRMAMLGIALFVAVPLPGTGAVGGTIVARLIGFSLLRSFLVVCLGTVIGAYTMAFGAHTLLMLLPSQPSSPWISILRLSISALLVVFLSWLGRRATATRRATCLEPPDGA